MMPYGGDSAPAGWLLCNGQEVEREDYQLLFDAIKFKFGAESQVTAGYFKVPDMRGRIPLGADNIGGTSANIVTAGAADIIGALSGTETKIIDITNVPEHLHSLKDADNNQFYAVQDRIDPTTDTNATIVDAPTATGQGQQLQNSGGIISQNDVGQPLDIMPPTVTMNYIIYTGRE
jgi:microcystin-dependent protein